MDVDKQIRRDYPGYTVLLKEVQDYYELPLSRYAYHQGHILIQVPVYVQQYAQVPLDLLHLKTVPVPLNVHEDNPTQEEKAYTRLIPKKPLLAVSKGKVHRYGCGRYPYLYHHQK